MAAQVSPRTSSQEFEMFEPYTLKDSSSKEHRRTKECQKIEHCGKCLKSKDNCGWCPISSSCVPLSPKGHLLSPINNKNICPLGGQERWELRTSTLGCGCSSATFLTALITFASTLVGLVLLFGLFKLIKYFILALRGSSGGWEVQEETAEIRRNERIWVRKQPSWGQWIKRKWSGTPEEEILVVGEYRPLLQ